MLALKPSGFPYSIASSMLLSMATRAQKVQENRLRRVASRRGLRIEKSRRRDPDALDYGLFAIFDIESRGTIHPHGPQSSPYALDLDDVREWLEEGA